MKMVGSEGIFAGFGTLALRSFTEAVTAIGASLTSTLGSRGALPGKDDFQLLITGTALGSFGFQLEEALDTSESQTSMFPGDSLLETAIERTQGVMQATLGTDDELTDAIEDADPRALDALRKFLETMVKNEAVCALEFKGEVFRFSDVEQVRRSMGRLAQDNIHEEDGSLAGVFEGVLPHRRTFEFRVAETDEIIVGRVDKSIEDASTINHVIDKQVTISVHSRKVGAARPRYVLIDYQEDVHSDE